jgi:DNA-binding response OmpR family regulator
MQPKTPEDMPHEMAPDVAGPRKKVALVVDDDPAAADLLLRWLSRFGYTAISASNAEEGLELTRSRKPDIILLDALMPGKSGYEILPEMRAQTHARDTPIVLITVDDDRARGLDAGASDFVRKPIREAELRDLVAVYDKDMQGDVLIIEDDDDSADLLSRNLRRLGFTPHRASDGEEGVELMRSIQPRAIVLDLNMPRINGFEFIERVSAQQLDQTIPMLVFSGKDLSLIEYRKLNEAGCHFFLKGSASPREIVTTLRELVA